MPASFLLVVDLQRGDSCKILFLPLYVPLPTSALYKGRGNFWFVRKHFRSCHFHFKGHQQHSSFPTHSGPPTLSPHCRNFILQATSCPFCLLHPKIISRKGQDQFPWAVKPGQVSVLTPLCLWWGGSISLRLLCSRSSWIQERREQQVLWYLLGLSHILQSISTKATHI